MSRLRIRLFGGLRVARESSTPDLELTHSAQTLLAYLLLQRQRRHSRDALGVLLWRDMSTPRARSCLNTALWRLRRVLEPAGTPRGAYLLTRPGADVGFNAEGQYWLDVAVFEGCVARVRPRPSGIIGGVDLTELELALDLYVGPLLDGMYDEWALAERDRLHRLFLTTLARLMRHHAACGAYEQAVAYGARALDHDPLQEEIHREMMRLHLATGERALALRQFAACEAALRDRLGVEPSEETLALHAQVSSSAPLAGRAPLLPPPVRELPPPVESPSLEEALEQLRRAKRQVDELRRSLDEGIDLVERLRADEAARESARAVAPGSLRPPRDPGDAAVMRA